MRGICLDRYLRENYFNKKVDERKESQYDRSKPAKKQKKEDKMSGYNHVTLVGNLVKDPETKKLENKAKRISQLQ